MNLARASLFSFLRRSCKEKGKNKETLKWRSPRFFQVSSLVIYLLAILFVLGWWSLMLHPFQLPPPLFTPYTQPIAIKTSLLSEKIKEILPPLDRHQIQRALSGHVPSMAALIEEWHREAQLMEQAEISQVQKLPQNLLHQARVISFLLAQEKIREGGARVQDPKKALEEAPKQESLSFRNREETSSTPLSRLNHALSLPHVADDCGRWISTTKETLRCLPQSYLAAHFLLAIAKPHEILALPKGLRQLPAIYPREIGEEILLNTEEITSERMAQLQADVAFTATYSHPPTLHMFHRLAIPLYSLHFIRSPEEIQRALLRLGHVSHHILEAQLLAIFMQATFFTVDNRLLTLHSSTPRKGLFLSFYQHFRLPTEKSLTGQLITRALKQCPSLCTEFSPETLAGSSAPFSLEQITQSDPDFLILSTEKKESSSLPSLFHRKKEGGRRALFWVDEAIQNSPTQYVALAYVDLYLAMATGLYPP